MDRGKGVELETQRWGLFTVDQKPKELRNTEVSVLVGMKPRDEGENKKRRKRSGEMEAKGSEEEEEEEEEEGSFKPASPLPKSDSPSCDWKTLYEGSVEKVKQLLQYVREKEERQEERREHREKENQGLRSELDACEARCLKVRLENLELMKLVEGIKAQGKES